MMMLKKSSSFNIVAQNVSVAIYAYLMGEKQQTAECVFIQYCAEKTKSTKLEEKFWIKDCAQNEKSIFLQARLSKCQPRLQVFNLESKWRKLQEKLLRLNIAPKTKNHFSCRRGWDCLNLACGKVNLASRRKKLWWNVILSNIFA